MTSVAEDRTVRDNLLEYTTKIVASHVSNNAVSPDELTDLIDTVFGKLSALSLQSEKRAGDVVPAVPVEDSIHNDHIICLEDGKSFKMLKKHLKVHYNMTPAE